MRAHRVPRGGVEEGTRRVRLVRGEGRGVSTQYEERGGGVGTVCLPAQNRAHGPLRGGVERVARRTPERRKRAQPGLLANLLAAPPDVAPKVLPALVKGSERLLDLRILDRESSCADQGVRGPRRCFFCAPGVAAAPLGPPRPGPTHPLATRA